MFDTQLSLRKLLDYLGSLIEEHSKPNPKYFKETTEYDSAHLRNKMVISIYLLLIFYFIIGLFGFEPILFNIIRIGAGICVLILTVISYKYNPQIFYTFINLVLLSYGPLIAFMADQGLRRGVLSSLVIPVFVYLFTGSLYHYLLQAVVQYFYINTFYYTVLENNVTYMTPSVFSSAITTGLSLTIIHTAVLITLIYYLMRRTSKKLSQVEKKKDEFENQKTFLLGFSHELRNLINSLTGNVKIASLENITGRAKELLLNAEVCGELLLHLVNNILDTGKVEIGELEINPVPNSIYDTLERIWGVCSELIHRKNLNGKINIEKDLPKTMMIDHYRLTQIFLNLVGNSVKFTERGSIDIKVSWISSSDAINEECFQPYPYNYFDDHDEGLFEKQKVLTGLGLDKNILTLDLRTRKIDTSLLKRPLLNEHGTLKVSISDTGCGMSDAEIDKLFQKFTQVTSDISKRKLGTGLGLFITKQLCQRMNGGIKAFSKKGEGSTFIFCIPVEVVQRKINDLQDLEVVKQNIKSQNLKAMIVDDTPFNNIVLQSFFDKLGIEVIDVAVNGLEAYQKYLKHVDRGTTPHIITMDLDMPIMDGKEAAQKIREVEEQKGLKPCFLAIISGNCSESEITECLDERKRIKANKFLKKPVAIEDLLRVLGQNLTKLTT